MPDHVPAIGHRGQLGGQAGRDIGLGVTVTVSRCGDRSMDGPLFTQQPR
jgi:hypothetical protein